MKSNLDVNEKELVYINRESLLNKLAYLPEYRYRRNKYSSDKAFILDELQKIKNELQINEGINQPYYPCERAKHCINEFVYYLDKNQLEDSLYDIYEVIESDKQEIYSNRDNQDYKYYIYISDEEKSIILSMVNMLEAKLNNVENPYSSEELYKKGLEKFYIYFEPIYGVNRSLSLPLPISHNKLKSLIYTSPIYTKYYGGSNDVYSYGYVLFDMNTGKIEYMLEKERKLSANSALNLLNIIPKTQITITSKEEHDDLKSRYFKLLDDLILIYGSKKDLIETDKISEFLNIYRNFELEQIQVEDSLNEFLSWCLLLLKHRPKIEKLEFEKPNIFIREYYIDENGHEQEREIELGIPISQKEENDKEIENKEKLTVEEFNALCKQLMEKHQEIKLKDNKKNLTYVISKDDTNFNIKIEKSIKSNDNINELFEKLKQYIENLGDLNEYWPNPNQEYPDLMVLWEIITKFNNEQNRLNGALKYPNNWEEKLLEIKETLINIINEDN